MATVRCKRCEHEWEYTGHKESTQEIPAYTSCSICRANVKIPVKTEEQ